MIYNAYKLFLIIDYFPLPFSDLSMDSNSAPHKFQHVDILSFDGGGSRGIMEVSILSDVMRLATILWQEPETLSYLTESSENVLESSDGRKKLVNDLDKVSSPLHPTKIYDMIVGTSTGALIAFGLVGGKENDGERVPMTLQECIDMYLEKTKEIFSKSWSHWIISHFPGCGSIPLATYPQDNVNRVLLEKFGESYLADFEESNSVAGAVARQIDQKEELVLFDTRTESYKFYKTRQVLLASSNAPVYFETPVIIGSKEFVDGGVGGNCPLIQAIPRAKEIFSDKANAKITSALSVAPPLPKKSHIPHYFQIKYWLNYFVNQSTDGYAVYKDAQQRYKDEINFRRLSPRGESLKDFKLDEIDAQKMLDAVNEERLNNDMFLVDVVAAAAVVIDTYFGKAKESPEVMTAKMGAQLAQMAGDNYAKKIEYELALNSYETSISLWKKVTNEDTKVVIEVLYDNIAKCLKEQGKYQQATQVYQLIVDHWKECSSDISNTNIAKARQNLAQCLWSCYKYKEAQKELELALKLLQKMHSDSPANAKVASILNSIGWCQSQQGDFTQAVNSFSDALKMQQENDVDQFVISTTLNCLGLCLSDLGKHDEAIKHVHESLEMRKRVCGCKDNPSIAESLNNLGWCLIEEKEYAKAHSNLEMSLNMKRNHFGDINHLSIATTLENFAKCLCNENENDLAVEYVQDALQMKKSCLAGDGNNAGIAKTLSIAGLIFEKTGDFQKAETFCLQSMRMTTLLLGPTHPTLVDILSCLGQSLVNQQRYKEAKIYFGKAVAIKHQNTDLTAIVDKRLADCLENLGSMQ